MFCTADSADVHSQPASGAPSGVFCVYSLLLSFKPRLQSPQTVLYHVSLRTPPRPPSGNFFYFCLPFHLTLFYLFIFLFRFRCSSCCALLGRFGRCLGRGDDRTPSIMQNVSTGTAWQPCCAASASCVGGLTDSKTAHRQEEEQKIN